MFIQNIIYHDYSKHVNDWLSAPLYSISSRIKCAYFLSVVSSKLNVRSTVYCIQHVRFILYLLHALYSTVVSLYIFVNENCNIQ